MTSILADLAKQYPGLTRAAIVIECETGIHTLKLGEGTPLTWLGLLQAAAHRAASDDL